MKLLNLKNRMRSVFQKVSTASSSCIYTANRASTAKHFRSKNSARSDCSTVVGQYDLHSAAVNWLRCIVK